MATFLFLCDAMRSDYISKKNTPFLWNCIKNGEYYKRVIPGYGFCERTEILTGLHSDESGFFTAIGYDPDNSPYSGVSYLNVLNYIENIIPKKLRVPFKKKPGGFYRAFRHMINKLLLTKYSSGSLKPYAIPYSFLPYLNLTEDNINFSDRNQFSVPSIIDLLKDKGKDIYIESFTGLNFSSENNSDNSRLDSAINNINDDRYALFLIYIEELDAIGHNYGPNSEEIDASLKSLDTRLKQFYSKVTIEKPDSNFIYLGDHGMSEVSKVVDVERELHKIESRLTLKKHRDYIYFLDSTIMRIWFMSDEKKKKFQKELSNNSILNQNGFFLNEQFAKEHNIPWGNRKYGDLVWIANNSTLIFPDFFHREYPYKGMHGYNPNLKENQGVCITTGKNIEKKEKELIELTDIYDVLKKTLKIDKYRG